MSFYDYPEDVKRLTIQAHLAEVENMEKKKKYFKNAVGYTCWGGIFAPEPWLSTQCDLSVMFGPDIFEEFVLWELKMSYNRSPKYNYYHMDGPEQLPHLPLLLSIENLRCIQYVPRPEETNLSRVRDIYKPISDAGKNIWYTGDIEDLDQLGDVLGTLKGVFVTKTYSMKDYDYVMKLVEKFV